MPPRREWAAGWGREEYTTRRDAARLWRAIVFTTATFAIAIVLLPNNSTAVDRIALYVIPLQLVVGARLPGARPLGLKSTKLILVILGFCVTVEFV